MTAIIYVCFKLEEKNRSFKRDRRDFFNIMGDKFTMSIRRRKLKISICKKLFSCINYLQLLK